MVKTSRNQVGNYKLAARKKFKSRKEMIVEETPRKSVIAVVKCDGTIYGPDGSILRKKRRVRKSVKKGRISSGFIRMCRKRLFQ